MNAQITFIEGQFSLIHIPLSLYSSLLQPILRILLPHGGPNYNNEPEGHLSGLSPDQTHAFLNISVTPLECSIVCHVSWAQTVFLPLISRLPKSASAQCHISKETYIVFSVSSAGLEAGKRVMDLTAPLAMAAIPIFFITTYYTDFILVPSKSRHIVGSTLLERGFEFSENESAYVVPPSNFSHARIPSTTSEPPSTPPPSNVAELQTRTFSHLKKRNVIPFITQDLYLAQCSGKEILSPSPQYNNGHTAPKTWLDTIDPKFYIGLVAALVSQPRFLSITLAQDDAPSLLLDKSLLSLFGNSLVGDTGADLVPIFLDLGDLPLESTGIVCGVAGKLVEGMSLEGRDREQNGNGVHGLEDRMGECGLNEDGEENGASDDADGELSYLSTARAGAVILSREGSRRALERLLPLLEKEG